MLPAIWGGALGSPHSRVWSSPKVTSTEGEELGVKLIASSSTESHNLRGYVAAESTRDQTACASCDSVRGRIFRQPSTV